MAAEEFTRPPFLNPMVLWADLGLRALDSTVSTSQKIGDTVDRMTRASAAPDTEDVSESAAGARVAADASGLVPVSPVALMTRMHRTAFDSMQQGWLQWMSMVGTLTTAVARRGMTAAGSAQDQAAASIAAIEPPVDAAPSQSELSASPRREAPQARGESDANGGRTEHAHAAAAAPKRRPRAVAKRKSGSRNS